MANNNPNPNSGGKPKIKDRLIQIEVNLATILENEKTLYDEITKIKGALEKIATVVDQHSQVLAQFVGGGQGQTQLSQVQGTPTQAVPSAPAPRQDDLGAALSIIGPVLEYLSKGKGDPVTNQLVGAALQSAVETLKAGPLLVQAIASALGSNFGKSYGSEAGRQLAKNLGKVVETTAQVVENEGGAENAVLEK